MSKYFLFFVLFSCILLNVRVAHCQITQRGSTQTSNSLTNTITISSPVGLQVDDILIAQVVQSDNDNATLSDATSAGWTLIKGRKVKTNNSREWWATLMFKRVTESDLATGSYTFTLDADAVGDGSAGEIVAFYGVSWNGLSANGVANSGPFDNTISLSDYTANNGNSSNISATAITTLSGGSGVFMFSAIANARYHNIWSLNGMAMTEICDYPNLMAANNGSGIAWKTQFAAGTTGNGAVSLSKGAGGGAILISLKSASSATLVANGSTSFCSGGSVELQATTGAGNTYQWFLNGNLILGQTGATLNATQEGNYYAIVTNSSGVAAQTGVVSVVVHDDPTVSIFNIDPISFCTGGSSLLSSTEYAFAAYQWYLNGVQINGAIDSVYQATNSGNYYLAIESPNGCPGLSNTIAIQTLPNQTFYRDFDSDGFGNLSQSVVNCIQPIGYVVNSLDCNDNNAIINPSSTEICNNLDDNCDTQIDNGLTFVTYYVDGDGDGFGAGNGTSSCVSLGSGYSTNNTDCNNNNASINPFAAEICNNLDDDCDTQVDNGLTFVTYYVDADSDEFGAGNGTSSCAYLGSGYATTNTDCNDGNANIYPSAIETCNNLDDDCDTQIDNGLTFITYYLDGDGDGFGAGFGTSSCSNIGLGYSTNNTDCNNTNASINPSALEICNNLDDNCDTQIDNGLTFVTYYIDGDGDGFGAGNGTSSCVNLGAGYAITNTDCNDGNASFNPTASEICNNLDDDCDTQIDNGLTFVTYYVDGDGDGFGSGNGTSSCINLGSGYAITNTDCNDVNANINPTVSETCNNLDDDCDTQIDNGLTFVTYYTDGDGDGFGAGNGTTSCVSLGLGYAITNTDCNDVNANINPSVSETCNNLDDDCDTQIDNGLTFVTYYTDGDGDGYGAGNGTSSCEDPGVGYVTSNSDCDDSNNAVNPNALEIGGNGIDDDCDGSIDNSIHEIRVNFLLYPNPAISDLIIEIQSALVGEMFFIYDGMGRLVHQEKVLSQKQIIDVENLSNGNYIIRVGSLAERFMVQR